MRVRALLCLALLVAARWHAAAQTAIPPEPRPMLPPGPILDAAPDFSAWTVVRQTVPGVRDLSAEAVVRAAASSAPPESLTSITKTGRIRHQLRKLKTGQEDIWYEHGNRITMESGWKIPMFEVATSPTEQPQGPDFPELAWIAAGNFVGIQNYGHVDYLVFEFQVADVDARKTTEYGYKPTTTLHRAFVNVETRMPWLLQTGNVIYRYVFQASPAAPLEVPPAFQAMFDTFEKKKAEAVIHKPVAP